MGVMDERILIKLKSSPLPSFLRLNVAAMPKTLHIKSALEDRPGAEFSCS